MRIIRLLIIGGSLPPEFRNGHNRTDGYSKAVWNITNSISKYCPEIDLFYIPYHLTKSFRAEKNLYVHEVNKGKALSNLSRLIKSRSKYKFINKYVFGKKRFEFIAKNLLIESSVIEITKRYDFDIIHVHGVTPEFFSYFEIIKKSRIPILLTLHGIYSQDNNIKTSFDKKFEFDACRKHLDIGTSISTVSEYTSRELENYLGLEEKSVHTVENGINIKYYESSESKKNAIRLREKLGISPGEYVALSVGSLGKLKNQELYIRTLVKMENSKVHYILVGDGNEKINLESIVNENNLKKNVHFLGRKNIDELIDIYDASDYLVHLPSSEGFGLVYAEALSRGKPILSYSDLPFPKKFLNESNSVLVDKLDINNVILSTKRIIKRIEEKEFDKEAIRNASFRFHPKKMVEGYLNLYRSFGVLS